MSMSIKLPGSLHGDFVRITLRPCPRRFESTRMLQWPLPGVVAVHSRKNLATFGLHLDANTAGDKQMVLADGKVPVSRAGSCLVRKPKTVSYRGSMLLSLVEVRILKNFQF